MPIEQRAKVLARLDELQIPYELIDHAAVFTVEEMERLLLPHTEKVAKNLFIRDEKKRNYYLVVMQKDKSANLRDLRSKIGSKPLSFASEDDLYKYLKLGKGEVSPLGVLNDADNAVTVIIDNYVKNQGLIGVHPNDNTATVYISVDDLIKFLNVKGRQIMFIDL